MGFTVDFDELTTLGFSVNAKTSNWSEQLTSIQQAIGTIIEMESFKGAGASNAKDYLNQVHMIIIVSFSEIFAELCTRFLLYKDGYYSIDSDLHAQLCEDTLDQLLKFFQGSHSEFDATHLRIRSITDSISDIMSADPASPYSVSTGYETVIRDQNSLKDAVNAYEAQHLSQDFVYLDAMISALARLILEYKNIDSSMAAYTSGAVMNSANAQALGRVLQDAYTSRSSLGDQVETAAKREADRFEKLEAEWAQAREEQGWLNLVMGALVVVGGVVCIVATAGMATPFVVAGAVAGMATIGYGASNMIEAGQDIYYGANGDYLTASFNPYRDTVFAAMFGEEGKQQAWDTFGTVAIWTSSVLSLGAGAAAAYARGATAVGGEVCREVVSAAGRKAVAEFGIKTIISAGVGTGTGYLGQKIALEAGASDSVAGLIGLGSGFVGGFAAGAALNKWQWSYEPGSRGIPEGVCFVAGTPVLTALGSVAVEEIVTGDKVMASNPETGETAEKPVLETYVRSCDQLVHVWINDEELRVTPNHLFHVLEAGWVKAANLKAGDQLRTPSGEHVPIQLVSLETLVEAILVYNFEVADFHSYYVGNINVLVHNADYAPRRPVTGVIRTEQHPDGSITYTKKINGQEVSVTYSKEGYPDFSPFAHPDHLEPVRIEYSGNRNTDYARANQAAGISGSKPPKGFVWHHMEDGESMLLVQKPIHETTLGGFPHTGGFSINKNK